VLKMDPQLHGDSPQSHAGPLIGMLCTSGSYVALTRVCTVDIQRLNNKGPCMSWLQRTVLLKMDLQLRGDSLHRHAGPLTGMQAALHDALLARCGVIDISSEALFSTMWCPC
jgi:hypothetical protein